MASYRDEQHSQEPFQENVPLPFSPQQSTARARVTISDASRLLMSSLAVVVSLTSELSRGSPKPAFEQQFISCDLLETSGLWLLFLCLSSKTKHVLLARRYLVLAAILTSISEPMAFPEDFI